MRPSGVSRGDFDRRLVDLVERLARDYEAHHGLMAVVHAVRRAREDLDVLRVTDADGGLGVIETSARQQLEGIIA